MATIACPTKTATAAASAAVIRSKSASTSTLSQSFSLSSLKSFPSKTLNPLRLATRTIPTKFLTNSSTSSYLSLTEVIASGSTPTAAAASSKTLKSRLHKGETLYGIFLLSFSPTLAEIAGLAGYDFVVVDMEHGPGGISEALNCLRALAATGTPGILRLPETCPAWAKKALDLGPQGIMFPMIENAKEAKKAVSYCRFPPSGVRGSAHTVVRASNYGIDEGYLTNYADELLILCQVESQEGAKNADEIAAVDGVDCIQMGPLDLSANLGYLWDPGHKKVREVLRTAEKAVLGSNPGKGGAFLAGFAMPHDHPEDLKSRGYHMVSGAVDVGLFRSAAVEDVKAFKSNLIGASDDVEGEQKYWSE